MSNANYAIAAGGYTGQPAYTAFGIETSLTKNWENVYLAASPLLVRIKEGKSGWNKPGLAKGNAMLLPLLLAAATTLPNGVTDANELTAITPYITSGPTQAQFNIAHYRHAMYLRASEKRLINNTRGNILEAKTEQLMSDFVDMLAGDLYSANADSREAVLGIQYALSTSNTVGNIDQSSVTAWQANVTASAGAFSLDLIDDGMDAVANKRGKVDTIALAYSSSNNLFSKLRSQINPAQRLVNTTMAKYGFESIEYNGATCVMDGRLTAGVIIGLDSRTWFYAGDDKPQAAPVDRLEGTDADEYFYTMFAGVATNNPGKNFRLTGVS